MTLDEAYEIVDEYEQHMSEMGAEIGSGAVSMGWNGHDAMNEWRAAQVTPDCVREARALIAEFSRSAAAYVHTVVAPDADDLPF